MGFKPFKVGRIYHVRFRMDGTRRQVSTGETTMAKALEVGASLHADALLRSHGAEPMPTLSELVSLWLEAHQLTRSADHLASVERFGRCHLYDLGRLRLDQITTERIEIARALHLLTRAKASANHWLRVLNLLIHWAIKRKCIRRVPWEVKMLKVQRRPRAILPTRKAAKWLAAVDAQGIPAIGVACRLMLGAGLRESEALAARWEWLDWERGTYTPGKTKGREADPVPVPGWLLSHLEPMRQSEGLIIPGPTGRPHCRGFTRQAFRKANAECGTPGLTPHRLRGTFATLLSEAGVPIQTIQKVMRHKDPRTSMGYLESGLGVVVKAQECLAKKMGMSGRKSGEQPHPNPTSTPLTE